MTASVLGAFYVLVEQASWDNGDLEGLRFPGTIAMCPSSAFHEYTILHRAEVPHVTKGGLNVKNLVGVVPFLRRASQPEDAGAENPEAPSYDGSDRYLGICDALARAHTPTVERGACLAPGPR